MLGEIKKFLRDDGIIKISRNIKELGFKIDVESIYEKIDEEGNELLEVLKNDEDEQGKIVDKLTVNGLLEKLNTRDRLIINLRYFKDKTQSQVAKILGISQVHVSRIEKRILSDFKNKMLV
jgi:RNA polymerase sporulation-specific sigma factor